MEAEQLALFSVEESLVNVGSVPNIDDVFQGCNDVMETDDDIFKDCPLTTGWTLPATESYLEEFLSIDDAWDVARAYGREIAMRYHSLPVIRRRVAAFVTGLVAGNDFDDVQEEHLLNVALTHADIELQARQH